MLSTIVYVKANHGSEKVKMKVFSQHALTDSEKKYLSSLTRDEAIKYGPLHGWKVIDASEWA